MYDQAGAIVGRSMFRDFEKKDGKCGDFEEKNNIKHVLQ